MVKKKGEENETPSWIEYMRKQAEEYDKSVIQTAWFVVEHTPGYNTGGYYDQDIPAENVRVSDYFDEKSEAEAWRDEHEPDKGKQLLIGHQDKTRKVVERWGPMFIERAK